MAKTQQLTFMIMNVGNPISSTLCVILTNNTWLLKGRQDTEKVNGWIHPKLKVCLITTIQRETRKRV